MEQLLSQLETYSEAAIAKYKKRCLRKAKLSLEMFERWFALPMEERRQTLRRLDPQIPDLHRPIPKTYDILVGNQDLTDEEAERLHGILSCPYWTVEDTCHRDNLLLLLERRTYLAPGYFAAFDLEQANIAAFGHDYDQYDYFEGCAMSLRRFTYQNYGRLYSKDECGPLDIPFSHDVGFAIVQM